MVNLFSPPRNAKPAYPALLAACPLTPCPQCSFTLCAFVPLWLQVNYAKQTQFPKPAIAATGYTTKSYANIPPRSAPKNKPKQTQSKIHSYPAIPQILPNLTDIIIPEVRNRSHQNSIGVPIDNRVMEMLQRPRPARRNHRDIDGVAARPFSLRLRRAGDGSRTHMTSLEGWGFTAKLHPLGNSQLIVRHCLLYSKHRAYKPGILEL